MTDEYHPDGTRRLSSLEDDFEFEPSWGSPIFEDDHALELSDNLQTVKIRLAFKDFDKTLLGRAPTRPDDSPAPAGDLVTMIGLSDIDLRMLDLDALTKEERHHAKALPSAVLPLTDLQPFSAYTLGVSRKHAVVEKDGRHLMLTSLYSINGTRLNGTILLPLQRRIIRHGDALQLGALHLQVHFFRSQKGD